MENRKHISRRLFLGTAGALIPAWTIGQTPYSSPRTKPVLPSIKGRKPLAVIGSTYYPLSHSYHIAGRFLHGYYLDGKYHLPEHYIHSVFTDQKPEKGINYWKNLYEKVFKVAFKFKYVVLGFVLLLFGGSIYLALTNGFEYFPASDEGQLTVSISNPTENPLSFDDFITTLDNLAEDILAFGDVEVVGISLGSMQGIMFGIGNSNNATANVVLKDDRVMSTTEVQSRLEDLLLDKDTLSRIWILRNYVNDMNTVEAMEFIRNKIARTRTNEFDWNVLNELNVNYSKALWQICSQESIPLIYASSAATYGNGENGFSDEPSKIKNPSISIHHPTFHFSCFFLTFVSIKT